MKIAVTGASGLVGTALCGHLKQLGHETVAVVRSRPHDGEIAWDPAAGTIDSKAFEGLDAVVHLAGDNIAKGRWTAEKKRRIRDSRVQGTRLLSEALAGLEQKPNVFISTSAIGFYGDQREEPVTEASDHGTGFLADVCREWEAAADAARESGIRTVHPRIGVVLSKHGGAVAAMLTPFKLGLGGIVGHGRQMWSWISIVDLVGAIEHMIQQDSLEGPVNATAPQPSSNAEFTKHLAHVLGRPAILPMPAFAARLLLGEMADALLLSSSQVRPEKLLESGYEFKHEHLDAALRALLK